MGTSPSTVRATLLGRAARARRRPAANTLVTATASTGPPAARGSAPARPRRAATISRPSNSKPPPTIRSPAETAARRSSGQPNSGRTTCVAGAADAHTATRRRPRALEHRVRGVGRAQHHVGDAPPASTVVDAPRSMAASMPVGDVGRRRHLGLREQPVARRRARRRRCSCRRRRCRAAGQRAGACELLDRDVVEVVAEGRGPASSRPARRPPDRVAREGDDRDALAVAQPLGRDRLARLGVEHGDEVGHDRQHLAVLERDEVLVLDLEPQRRAPASAPTPSIDRRAADEAAGGPALDVDHLADDQLDRRRSPRHERRDGVVLGLEHRPPDAHRER